MNLGWVDVGPSALMGCGSAAMFIVIKRLNGSLERSVHLDPFERHGPTRNQESLGTKNAL